MNNIIQPCNIEFAADLLKSGQVVAIPTETVYGLAADISQEAAVKQIFALKGRPENHPLIIHISAVAQLETYATHIPDYAYQLAKHFWPGPLTLVLFKSNLVGNWVTGGQDTVGIRMPNHPLALQLIEQVGSPLAAPSANQFGKISPTHPAHVQAEFGDVIQIVEGGACEVGIESTIVDATDPNVCTILRPGMISEQQIQAILGSHIRMQKSTEKSRKVSGTLKSHYAPNKPTFMFNDAATLQKLFEEHGRAVYGLYLSDHYATEFPQASQMPLNEHVYAQSIYDALRKADNSEQNIILIEKPPFSIEWTAIIDRLERSCA